MSKGILLIGYGKKYYLDLAIDLALSVKSLPYSHKIALVVCESNKEYFDKLPIWKKNAINDLILIPRDKFTRGGVLLTGLLKIVSLANHSPFDETLFIDVDTGWFQRSADTLFNELSSVDIQFQTKGSYEATDVKGDFMGWISAAAMIKQGWKPKKGVKIVRACSTMVYYKKNEQTKKLFQVAEKWFWELYSGNYKYAAWQNNVPDELCFMLALHELGITLENDNYQPIFDSWKKEIPSVEFPAIYNSFYGITMPGSRALKSWARMYDIAVGRAYSRIGRKKDKKWTDKKDAK